MLIAVTLQACALLTASRDRGVTLIGETAELAAEYWYAVRNGEEMSFVTLPATCRSWVALLALPEPIEGSLAEETRDAAHETCAAELRILTAQGVVHVEPSEAS